MTARLVRVYTTPHRASTVDFVLDLHFEIFSGFQNVKTKRSKRLFYVFVPPKYFSLEANGMGLIAKVRKRFDFDIKFWGEGGILLNKGYIYAENWRDFEFRLKFVNFLMFFLCNPKNDYL